MTPDDWRTCSDPERMLAWLHEQGKLSARKARLFAVACCRRIWPLLTDERSRTAVEVAERYADGEAVAAELDRARGRAHAYALDCNYGVPWVVAGLAVETTVESVWLDALYIGAGAATAVGMESPRPDAERGFGKAEYAAEREQQAALLRDLVHPHCTTSFNPALRTPTVVALATTIYADRTFDNLPILADALEEVGCTDAELLGHLRGPGPHAGRGCWAVDVVLGKS